VGCSDGAVYRVDWTSGEGTGEFWTTSTTGLVHMAVASIDAANRKRDIVYTTETRNGGGWRITAHELAAPGSSTQPVARAIYTSTQEIQILKASSDGSIIVAASGNRILLGSLRSSEFETVDKIRYEFRVFESSDHISSIDMRVSEKPSATKLKASKVMKVGTVDVVVGDVRGAIFVHNNLLANLIRAETVAVNVLPRKLHWHRKAVGTVKWSADGRSSQFQLMELLLIHTGNYVISGGSETVMVLWQLDTGRQQFLPHMSATIQSIVVSPTGASYAVGLADNSTMVLSTSELKPTANISGLQARVSRSTKPADFAVVRLKEEIPERPLMERVPAAINPAYPSRLLLAVGEIQEVDPKSTPAHSVPYLQTFDLASSHNVSRQALSRTNVTNKNIAPNAHSISEARVVHMKISHDGKWLATVDEWLPPRRDVSFLGHGGMDIADEQRRRREVFLKFWQWSSSTDSWELVSRIDAPHMMSPESCGAGKVLDLVADPNSMTFSTIGEDSIVRVWHPRARKRDGVVVKGKDGEPLMTWSCQQSISLAKPEVVDDSSMPGYSRPQRPEHGCLAFSDDGSVLAAAVTGSEDGLVHLIDPIQGSTRLSRSLMYQGDVLKIAFVAQHMIILSDDLRVYDMVQDELTYGIKIWDVRAKLSLDARIQMMHLAVDPDSGTFAVALPSKINWLTGKPMSKRTLNGRYTEVAVFDPNHARPFIVRDFASIVTALIPAVSSAGFVVLDASAEVTTITPKTSQTLISMAKPMAELRLDVKSDEQPTLGPVQLEEDGEEYGEDGDENDELAEEEDVTMEDIDDDGPPVVSQQQLANVFDVGPAFALPPIEEMFYQVAGLFSSKSMAQEVS
jgi:NET1-associated nuclear protein 1 (U3 small nucleolar RNA-associated protein 17)